MDVTFSIHHYGIRESIAHHATSLDLPMSLMKLRLWLHSADVTHEATRE